MDCVECRKVTERGGEDVETRGMYRLGIIAAQLSHVQHLKHVRKDLEILHELTLLSRKRESRKLAQDEAIQKVLDVALFPHLAPMRLTFEKVLA